MTELLRLSHGVHRPADAVRDLSDRCAAFLDVLPAGAVIGGMTAARLHGLWLPPGRDDESIEMIVTRRGLRPHEYAGSRRREIRVRRRTLRRDEVVEVAGLPVVDEARTWVDLAETLRIEDLVAAGDSVLCARQSRDDLIRAVDHAQHRRGVRRAREALALLDPRSRSRPESWIRCTLVRAGLPWPEVNVPICNEYGEWLAEADLLYRRARLVIEYNGADHASVLRMRRDISRELDIEEGGWHVLVFGPVEVFRRTHRLAPEFARCSTAAIRAGPEDERRPLEWFEVAWVLRYVAPPSA
jgi:hypothetical protein